jgi:hypothetical protein
MPERLSPKIRSLLVGDPWGELHPPRDNPPPLSEDGRTVALRIFKLYLSELVFYRRMGEGVAPSRFQIPEKDIHIEWPDYEADMVFPSIVLQAIGPATYNPIGLGGYIEEKSLHVYAPGTAVQWQNEYTETFAIDIYASKKSERRAIIAALIPALSPTEQMYGIRFHMPDYYEQLVCFSLEDREIFEDADAARNRRRARVRVEMRYNDVALVNVGGLTVQMKVHVDADAQTGEAITLDTEVVPDDRDPSLPPLARGPIVGSTC